MPDYDLREPTAVKMTVYGSVVDPAYSRMLIQKTDLPLDEILALDRVRKKLPLADDVIKRLRRDGLIEGRKPNLFVSASLATVTARKAEYIRARAQDDDYYCKLITDYLKKFGGASRKEIDRPLVAKLSEALGGPKSGGVSRDGGVFLCVGLLWVAISITFCLKGEWVMSQTRGVKLDDTIQQRLTALARIRDRSPHWLMCKAIETFLEREEKYEREKREDMERWERYQLTGEAVSHEKAAEWLENLAQGKVISCPK
ncbi:hypothetical protein Plut_0979 [Pelodictyon luteolum DSM 273]|uniref:Uncharacterized protein n=2 Tax=Pelodictyon luteolum TaxID=1100 RepID=Q3B490_CHLL3|nr:hypothetical protein [Pelodictyon luteolum]ABB23841.1 hypothetical protein Plut_0979 [Pelodictyon luteolum DSM 273]